MRLPCGHYGDEWEPDRYQRGPAGCTDPECAGGGPDPWLVAQDDDRQYQLERARQYRQSKMPIKWAGIYPLPG